MGQAARKTCPAGEVAVQGLTVRPGACGDSARSPRPSSGASVVPSVGEGEGACGSDGSRKDPRHANGDQATAPRPHPVPVEATGSWGPCSGSSGGDDGSHDEARKFTSGSRRSGCRQTSSSPMVCAEELFLELQNEAWQGWRQRQRHEGEERQREETVNFKAGHAATHWEADSSERTKLGYRAWMDSLACPLHMSAFALYNRAVKASDHFGIACRHQLEKLSEEVATASGTGAKGDLLPLPYELSAEDLALVQSFDGDGELLLKSNPTQVAAAARRVWLGAVALCLNQLYLCPQIRCENGGRKVWQKGRRRDRTTANQKRALDLLGRDIDQFLSCDDGSEFLVEPTNFWERLDSRKISYDGGIATKACRLTWEQLEQALPGPGLAGGVDAAGPAEGRVKDILLRPEAALKPRSEWPDSFKQAKVHVEDGAEWDLIGAGLAGRSILGEISVSELILDKGGCPLTIGSFGVEKGKSFMAACSLMLETLRLIANCIPCNELHRPVDGDTGTMPYPGCWHALTLGEDLVYFSAEDVVASFFLFALPKPWWKFFVFGKKFGGRCFGHASDERRWGCLRVIPMGWCLAVAIIQYLHRRLVHHQSALPRELKLRRDRPPPTDEEFRTVHFYQIFMDNYDEMEPLPQAPAAGASAWAITLRSTGEVLSVIYDPGDKRVERSLRSKTLGARSHIQRDRPQNSS